MTTKHFGDIDAGLYTSYHTSEGAVMQSYVQSPRAAATGIGRLQLFASARAHGIPAAAYRGSVGEVLMYENVLAEVDRIKVETYLALKYGISRSGTLQTLYISSSDDVIWNSAEAGPYLQRVTGIGRDDASGLHQKQATNAGESGVLSIALGRHAEDNTSNSASLSDQSFLIWSDDGAPLIVEEGSGPLTTIQRNWRMQVLTSDELITEVRLDQDYLALDDAYEALWLRIQPESTMPATYHKGQPDAEGHIIFDSIVWDTDGSGGDVFSFAAGPDMFAAVCAGQASCHPGLDSKGQCEALWREW